MQLHALSSCHIGRPAVQPANSFGRSSIGSWQFQQLRTFCQQQHKIPANCKRRYRYVSSTAASKDDTAVEASPDASSATNISSRSSSNGSAAPLGSSDSKAEPWQWEESSDALRAYGAFFIVLAVGFSPVLRGQQITDLPYFISLAVCTIYIGAHRGLTSKQRQTINLGQGALAPVFASVALFGAYLLIKYLPELDLQTFFNCYFWLIGSVAVVGALAPTLRQLASGVEQNTFTLQLPEWLAKDEKGDPITEAKLAVTDFIALGLAFTAATVDLSANHQLYTLNNLIACAITTDILQLVGLRSFRVAAVMLMGLLLYDVFWVFGSPTAIGDNVMLTVATSELFTGPTRLLFPRATGSIGEASSFPFSLLGLGDIAVPGLLACLALRYDASRSINMQARADAASLALRSSLEDMPGASDFDASRAAAAAAEAAYDRIADLEDASRTDSQSSDGISTASAVSEAVLSQRTYFGPVMVAYVCGLAMAFTANAITHLGQPALLYIVPCTLGAIALNALFRGEVSQLLKFTDRPAIIDISGGKNESAT